MLKLNINKFCIGTKRRTNKQANKQRKKLKPMHHGRIKKRKPFDFVPRLIRFTQPTYNALIIIVKKCKQDFYFLSFFFSQQLLKMPLFISNIKAFIQSYPPRLWGVFIRGARTQLFLCQIVLTVHFEYQFPNDIYLKVLQLSAAKYFFHHKKVICPSIYINEMK